MQYKTEAVVNMRATEAAEEGESVLITESEIDMLVRMIEAAEEGVATEAETTPNVTPILDFERLLEELRREEDDHDDAPLVNRCTSCARDMGDANPRQLCGKTVCLLANEEEDRLERITIDARSEAMREEEDLAASINAGGAMDETVTIEDILASAGLQLLVQEQPIAIPMVEEEVYFEIEYDALFSSLVDWGEPSHEEMARLMDDIDF